MFRSLHDLCGFTVQAVDGDIGRAEDFFFDDENWIVRYLEVRLGAWIFRHYVLLSITSISPPGATFIPANLTKKQIEQSPDINIDSTVSRRNEIDLHDYYGLPYYWSYPPFSIPPSMPSQDIFPESGQYAEPEYDEDEEESGEDQNAHLRSCKDVRGYHVQAINGQIGHVSDFIFDDHDWTIRYLVIDTSNWLHGREVLIATSWISDISWGESKVFVNVTVEKVRKSPPFDPSAPVNRDYEDRIYDYYGRSKYWDKKE
jgi:uncharacterized protein YrrD